MCLCYDETQDKTKSKQDIKTELELCELRKGQAKSQHSHLSPLCNCLKWSTTNFAMFVYTVYEGQRIFFFFINLEFLLYSCGGTGKRIQLYVLPCPLSLSQDKLETPMNAE